MQVARLLLISAATSLAQGQTEGCFPELANSTDYLRGAYASLRGWNLILMDAGWSQMHACDATLARPCFPVALLSSGSYLPGSQASANSENYLLDEFGDWTRVSNCESTQVGRAWASGKASSTNPTTSSPSTNESTSKRRVTTSKHKTGTRTYSTHHTIHHLTQSTRTTSKHHSTHSSKNKSSKSKSSKYSSTSAKTNSRKLHSTATLTKSRSVKTILSSASRKTSKTRTSKSHTTGSNLRSAKSPSSTFNSPSGSPVTSSDSPTSTSATRLPSTTPSGVSSVIDPPTFTPLPKMYAGVNCYFLYTFPTSTQRQILSALKTAGVKTVRIFLTSFSQGGKGTNSLGSTDLELFTVGKYDDSILSQVDALMPLMVEYGLRLDVTMHDRWNLDNTWGICDTYCQTYCNGGSNLQGFYNNAVAQSAFDNRLAYIATHINPSMGNRAWKDLPEAIFSFSIQNEAQGTSNGVSQFTNADWWCGRATALRKVIGASKVLIGTGGGQDWSASLVTNNFACANMEVIGIHSYDGSINSIQANLQQAVNLSNTYGKRIIFQEFGTTGNKGAWITQVATVANGLGVPWSPWEVSSNSISNDYEFGTDDSEAWTALTTYALAAHE